MTARIAAAVLAAAALACPAASAAPHTVPTIQLVLSGDVMLGRGVAPLAAHDPDSVFAGIRLELDSADLAVANLESPLTRRPHDPAKGPNALEARPASARLLAAAGFDAMAIANNHAGDAGPGTVPDTIHGLTAAGLKVVGAGANRAAVYTPTVITAKGVRVASLSFDATSEGPRATRARPGVAWWNTTRVHAAVTRAVSEADLVVVGLHGGSDYNPTTDPWLMHLGRLLAGWGADVVWGTGPHVVQPTELIPSGRPGRVTLVATSLGNLLFDQHIPGTRNGELLDVLAGRDGVRAYRLGATAQQASNAVSFVRWLPPAGDAAAVGSAWWSLAGKPTTRSTQTQSPAGFAGQVVSAAIGDPEENGTRQVVLSFWRPYRRTAVNALIPRAELVDRRGLTAHLGVYATDRAELWVAGTLLRPVQRVAACDGAIAVAYSTLNGRSIVGTGAWVWRGFGFSPLPDLALRGVPACADIDGDGRLDPVILARTAP